MFDQLKVFTVNMTAPYGTATLSTPTVHCMCRSTVTDQVFPVAATAALIWNVSPTACHLSTHPIGLQSMVDDLPLLTVFLIIVKRPCSDSFILDTAIAPSFHSPASHVNVM